MVELNMSDNFLHCIAVHLGICGILWVLIIAAILVDLWDRVYTNKKLGKKIESHKMRITLEKVSEYWRFMIIAFTIDMVTFIAFFFFQLPHLPYLSMLLCIVLLIIEIKSLYEHAKERKSNLSDLNELIRVVVNAASDRDAKKAIKEIGEYLERDKDNEKY